MLYVGIWRSLIGLQRLGVIDRWWCIFCSDMLIGFKCKRDSGVGNLIGYLPAIIFYSQTLIWKICINRALKKAAVNVSMVRSFLVFIKFPMLQSLRVKVHCIKTVKYHYHSINNLFVSFNVLVCKILITIVIQINIMVWDFLFEGIYLNKIYLGYPSGIVNCCDLNEIQRSMSSRLIELKIEFLILTKIIIILGSKTVCFIAN